MPGVTSGITGPVERIARRDLPADYKHRASARSACKSAIKGIVMSCITGLAPLAKREPLTRGCYVLHNKSICRKNHGMVQKKDIQTSLHPHPGQVLKLYLDKLGLSVSAVAKAIGVSRPNFSLLLNERAAMSPEMAFRLEAALGLPAETWLTLQMRFDLEQAGRKLEDVRIEKLIP